jgi:hypothetical protein
VFGVGGKVGFFSPSLVFSALFSPSEEKSDINYFRRNQGRIAHHVELSGSFKCTKRRLVSKKKKKKHFFPLLFLETPKGACLCAVWPRSAVTGSCLLPGSSISVRLDLGTTLPGADRSSEYLGGMKAACFPGYARPAAPVVCPAPTQGPGEGRSEGQSGALLQLIDCMSPIPNLLNS